MTSIAKQVETRYCTSDAVPNDIVWFCRLHARHPNCDIDAYLAHCRAIQSAGVGIIMSVWIDQLLRAVVLCRSETRRHSVKCGYVTIPGVVLKTTTCLYRGIIAPSIDGELCNVIINECDKMLKENKCDVVCFSPIARDSVMWSALGGRRLAFPDDCSIRWAKHRTLTLKDDPQFLVNEMKSKHRSWLRKKEKEFSAACPMGIEWQWCNSECDVNQLFPILESIAARTYQRGLGGGFIDDVATRARLSQFAQRNMLRIFLVKADGRPVAFWLGVVVAKTFYSSSTGVLPEIKEHEVGTSMFLKMIEELVKEGVKEVDFGFGDAQYKERFGDSVFEEAPVILYGRGIKQSVLRCLSYVVVNADQLGDRIVAALGISARIKKFLRRRVQS